MSEFLDLSPLVQHLQEVCRLYSDNLHSLDTSSLSVHVSSVALRLFQHANGSTLRAQDIPVDPSSILKLCSGKLELNRLSDDLRGWVSEAQRIILKTSHVRANNGTERQLFNVLNRLAPAFVALTRLAWLAAWALAMDGDEINRSVPLNAPPGFPVDNITEVLDDTEREGPDAIIQELTPTSPFVRTVLNRCAVVEFKGLKTVQSPARDLYANAQDGKALNDEIWYSPASRLVSPSASASAPGRIPASSCKLWITLEGPVLLPWKKAKPALALLIQVCGYVESRRMLQEDGYNACVLTDLYSTWLEFRVEKQPSEAAQPYTLQIVVHRVQVLQEGRPGIDLFAALFRLIDISFNRDIHSHDANLKISWPLHPPSDTTAIGSGLSLLETARFKTRVALRRQRDSLTQALTNALITFLGLPMHTVEGEVYTPDRRWWILPQRWTPAVILLDFMQTTRTGILFYAPSGDFYVKRFDRDHEEEFSRELKAYEGLSGAARIPRLLAHGTTSEGYSFLAVTRCGIESLPSELEGDQQTMQKLYDTALADIHRRKWHHHDLHPKNIQIDIEGNFFIIDFGCAVYNCEDPHCADKEWMEEKQIVAQPHAPPAFPL